MYENLLHRERSRRHHCLCASEGSADLVYTDNHARRRSKARRTTEIGAKGLGTVLTLQKKQYISVDSCESMAAQSPPTGTTTSQYFHFCFNNPLTLAMSANPNGHPMASVAVFCPQSKAPGESYLNEVHSFLRHSEYLEPFVQRMLDLKDVWTILANERQDIADLGQGPRYIQNLSEWFATGKSSQIANCMSGILSLPLLVVIQICQYFQYLELHGMSHSQFMAQLRTGGGIQGYCGGLLPAIAIACSKTEAEVVENAARAARIALAIGAYGELGDDESVPGATTIVVRTKRVGQGDELIEKFPGVSSSNARLSPSSHHKAGFLTSAHSHTYRQSQIRKQSVSSAQCQSSSSYNLTHESRVCSCKKCLSEAKCTTPRTLNLPMNFVSCATGPRSFGFLTPATCRLA